MSTENITNKLDNNKDKKISEEELKNNIAKFDANDWIVLTNELEKKNAELVKLLESPVSKVIKEKKLYNKYNKSVDELKILKLGFLCYNRGSQARTGTGIDNYCLQYGNNWETYKKNELPKMGILRTGKVDEEWLRMERIDNIKQASDAAVRAGTKVEPVVKPAPTRKPIPVANPTPADAVRESIYVHELPDVGIVKVDEKENIKEGSIKEILDNITTWAHDTYFSEYETCKLEANKRYMKEEEKDKQAYVTYELYLFSFSKYCESINGKHNDIISQTGYESMDEFESQMELIKEFQDSIALSLKYDKIGDEMKKFEQYVKEMESNKDKYFKGKSEEDIQNAEEKYTEFQSFQEKKYKELGITEEILSSMNKIPESSGENQKYWENTEKILQCQIEINQWRQENGGDKDGNGDLIDKYDGYVKGGLKIRDKYSNLDFDLLNDYNNLIESWTSKGLDFKKYGEYASLMQKEGLNSHLKNISLIQSVLMDETNKEFPIPQIRDAAIKKKERQEKIERIRDKIIYTNEGAYYVFTSAVSMWNTLLDATIGVGTSLGAMICGIIGGKDEYAHQLKRKEKWDNFLKIGQSSSQTAPIYDSEMGAFNFHLDNTISTVSSSIVQMLCLRIGGSVAGQGIGKLGASMGINMSKKVLSKVGMFPMGFITQVGPSYQEAINGGLGYAGAFAYSMFFASIQGGLELISPNEVLVGEGIGLGKELVKNICGKGNKEGIKLIGKYFLKTVGREIAEENLQEGLQLAAGNLINDMVNGIWNTGLESDWNPKNFLSTSIITTLTTGIATGFSAGGQGVQILNSNNPELIARIASDLELYEDVMKILDNSINGNFKIPKVDKTLLQELRTTLNNIHTNQNNPANQHEEQQSSEESQTHNQLQEHEENDSNNSQEPMRSSNETIELDPEKQKMIESIGSKFHEERRKSLRKSDGTYESRIEQVTDQEWIQQHNGQREVDLANTDFEDLPQEWKHENLEAAKVVVELVYDKVVNGEEITPEMIEEMARVVHDKRLERNGTEGSFENQRVSYDQLDEEEKAKDRYQVLRAIEVMNKGNTDYFDGRTQKFGDYYSSALVKEFESFLNNREQEEKQNLKEDGYSDTEIEEALKKTHLENLIDFQDFILKSENATKEDFIKIMNEISIESKKYMQKKYPNMSSHVLSNIDKIYKWKTILCNSETVILDNNSEQRKNENGVYIYDKNKFYDEGMKKQAIEELKMFFKEVTGKELIIANDNNIGAFVRSITSIINNPEILNGMDYLMIGHGTGDSQISDSNNQDGWRLKDSENTNVYDYIENNIPKGKKILSLVCEHPSEERDIKIDNNGQSMSGIGKPVSLLLSSHQPAKILESGRREIIGHASLGGSWIREGFVQALVAREKTSSEVVYYNTDYSGGRNAAGDDISLINQHNETQGNEGEINIERMKNAGVKIEDSEVELFKNISLTDTEIENIKKITGLGIEIRPLWIWEVKDIILTDAEIENIQRIIELGVVVDYIDIKTIKNLILTDIEKNNIKKITELGIKITSHYIEDVKDINLTQAEIENIKYIISSGIIVNVGNIEVAKNLKLKEENIENIRKIIDLGISVSADNVEDVKNISLTQSDIEIIKMIKNEFGIRYISCYEINCINDIKGIKITQKDIENIKKLANIGVYINGILDIFNMAGLTDTDVKNIQEIVSRQNQPLNMGDIKHLKGLTKSDMKTLRIVKNNLGVEVTVRDIEFLKGIKLTKNDVKTIKVLKENLKIEVVASAIQDLKGLGLTEKDINMIKIIKEDLKINVNARDIKHLKGVELTEKDIKMIKMIIEDLEIDVYPCHIKELSGIELTEKDIETIKMIKEDLKIDISLMDIKELSGIELTEKDIETIKMIKEDLKIDVYLRDIKELSGIELTKKDIETIKMLKKDLKIDVRARDIKNLKGIELTEKDIETIKMIQEDLKIKVYPRVIKELKGIELTEKDIETIRMIKEDLKIKVYPRDIKELKGVNFTETEINNIKKVVDLGVHVEVRDIKYIKGLTLTETDIENIKNIKKSRDKIDVDGIKAMIEYPDIFGVQDVNSYEEYGKSAEEIEAHNHFKKGRLIETIQQHVQNAIKEDRDISEREIIDIIRPDLVSIPQAERTEILSKIYKIVNKFNTVRKYLDFENGPYKTPKELLCAMRGITDQNMIDKITDDITVIQHGTGLTFFVGDESSYQIIEDISLVDSGSRSGGFNSEWSAIKDLVGTLSVVNGKDPGNDTSEFKYRTIWHEGQHNWNSYFMPDKHNTPITRAKDEITAYLRDGWNNIRKIEYILTEPESEGGLYQYDLKGEARENHKKQVRELLSYANDLIKLTENPNTGLTRDKIISMLSDTPVDGWKDLHSNINEAVKLHFESGASSSKIIALKERFIANIQERAFNNKLVNNLVNFWNSMFPNYSIKMEEFWRAGTAKIETAINDIENCNSIQEIKHILNNPKYSHIGRGPNNLGGIEISNIIDEVVSGNLPITFIPDEIRPQVEKFIK